jgi:hypothetical protein
MPGSVPVPRAGLGILGPMHEVPGTLGVGLHSNGQRGTATVSSLPP